MVSANERLIIDLFPQIPWHCVLRMEMLPAYFGPMLFIMFFYELYPQEINITFLRTIQIMSIVFGIVILFISTIYFHTIWNFYQFGLIAVCSYSIYVLTMAAIHKREDARLILIGTILLCIYIGQDILTSQFLIASEYQAIYGFMVFIIFLDYTLNRKFIKAEKLAKMHQLEMIQNEKLASLGTLVAGVVHEIRNPNSVIKLNTKTIEEFWIVTKPILEEYTEENGEFYIGKCPFSLLQNSITDIIQKITDNSQRIELTVDKLRRFAYKDTHDRFEPININNLMQSAYSVIKYKIKECTNNCIINYDKSLPTILGNFHQLEQVIINIIHNSCQSLTKMSQHILITMNNDRLKKRVEIIIKDEGKGMNKETLTRIYDPFYTTKDQTHGTGLGMSISKTIVQNHRGRLQIQSSEGKGTQVTILLPASV